VRIAVLTTSYPRFPGDAAGHFVASEARALARTGDVVQVFAPGRPTSPTTPLGSEPEIVWLADHGAFGWPGALPRLREQPLRALGMAAFGWNAARALARFGPFDHVVAHFLVPCAWPVATLGLRPGSGSLEVVVHGSDARLFAKLPPALRRRIARALQRRGARVRCVSRSVRDELAGSAPGSLLEDAVVEPCILDLSGVPSRAEARRRLDLGPTEAIAVVVGRLVAGKRVAVALGALSLVPQLRVIVVGDGPERTRLERAFPGVRFTGNVLRAEALAYIAAADALASASRDEGAPSVVREARALGVPVVAVPAGDLVERARTDPGIFLT